MKKFEYTINDPVGIHARPAGLLAKKAKTMGSTVTIATADGRSAAASKLMALMGLGVKQEIRYPSSLREMAKRMMLLQWSSSLRIICK